MLFLKPFFRWVVFVVFTLALNLSLYASEKLVDRSDDDSFEHKHGTHDECAVPSTTLDVIKCVQNRHILVKKAIHSIEGTETLSAVAGQIQNPEVGVKSIFGRSMGDRLFETELSLSQLIELGGKRSARILGAEAQQEKARAELVDVKAQVTYDTVINLFRLSQLTSERQVLQEASATYKKVSSQVAAAPRLSPEQQVSLSVFRMAIADAKMREAELTQEELALANFFHLSTGHSLGELKKVLPKMYQTWPQVRIFAQSDEKNVPPSLLKLRADRKTYESDLAIAQASAWPDFSIGPNVLLKNEGGISTQLYGLSLSVPLPLFNVNGAGISHADRGVQRADRSIALAQLQVLNDRTEQVKSYRNSVTALESIMPHQALETEHQRNESSYLRGMVSSAILVEAHRQLAELVKSRHAMELTAIKALWRVYWLDGQILKEKL